MAKKITQQIELDVVVKGLENTKQSFSEMAKNSGNLGKEASSILKYIERIQKIIVEYGESIPVSEVKQMQLLFEKIASSSKAIGKMNKFDLVDEDSLKRLEKTKKEMEVVQSQIKDIQKQISAQTRKNSAQSIVATRTKELQQQKQANLNNKPVSLEPIKGKWKTKDDLQNLSGSTDPKVAKAAAAALQQLSTAEQKQKDYVDKLNEAIEELNAKLKGLENVSTQIAPQIRELSEEERIAAESGELFGESQARSLEIVAKVTQEAGQANVQFTTSLKEQKTGIGLAVKSLFSFATAWGLVKKLGKEAVQTITEMDESLTGMAMVTGKTKEEVNSLIPQIQQLSQETSTAMTEVAGLITEYTKQGRNLQESFILAEETAKAAKISGISAAEAIDYMTSAINGFNLAATDATKVSDIFANVAAVSATDFEDLAVGLSKVSAQANLAGMSIEYTTALIAKGIETTQEAPESIGTALKTILARMRELSDYGSTLEDGASVNGVESALAAAGIKLRDVNGEFRDMEDIFNELGPKWDSLNTMQQQAIAQAVAGTRQQSRFVAIMQDWERTQELAAEAQDSAGASAAQYAVYAEGMEAQLTKLKSSWQEFIQSITSSTFIVNMVKLIGAGLDKINTFLEKSPDLVKNTVIILGGYLAITQSIEKIRHGLGMQSTKDLELQNMQIENEKFLAQREKERLENRNKELDEAIKKLEKIEALEKNEKNIKEKTASKNEKEEKILELDEQGGFGSESIGNAQNILNSGDVSQYSAEQVIILQQIAELEKGIKQDDEAIKQLESEKNQLLQAQQEAQSVIGQEKINNLQAIQQKNQEIDAAEEARNELIKNSNNPLMQRLELLKQQIIEEERLTAEKIKQLEAQNDLLDADIATAKANGNNNKADALSKAKAKNEKTILKLKQKQQKLENKTLKINKQQNSLLSKEKGLMSTLATTLSTTIQSSAQNLLSKFGAIGQTLAKILISTFQWIASLGQKAAITAIDEKANKNITDEIKEQNNAEIAGNANKVVDVGLTEVKKEAEEDITDEKEEQTGNQTLNNLLDAIGLGFLKKKEKSEEDIGKTETKNTGKKATNTFLDVVSAFKSMGPAGIIAGLAIGASILAIVGIAAAVSAGNASGVSDSDAESSIGSVQNTNYQLKKKNKTLQSSTEEMDSIANKSIKTAEDEEKFSELAESLRNENENWSNLSDTAVLEAAKREIELNNDIISRNIDSNYELALKMEDLSGTIAQQALTDKLKQDQEDMIRNRVSDPEIAEAVTKTAGEMAEKMVDVNAEAMSDMVATKELNGWQTAGAVLGAAVANTLIPGIGSVATTLLAANQTKAQLEQEALDTRLELVNEQIVDFAVGMETAGDDIYDQLTTYHDLVQDVDEWTVKAAEKQYRAIAYLNKAISYSDSNSSDEQNKKVFEQTAKSLSNLSKAGVLAADGLTAIVEAAADIVDTQNEQLTTGVDAFENGISGTDNSGKKTKNVDLQSIRKELGLSKSASVNDIKEAYLKTYAKYNDDGTIKYDSNGNIAMKGNNKNKTAVYNALADLASDLGDFADLNEKQLAEVKKYSIQADLTTEIQDLLNNVNNDLGLSNKSEEQLLALQNDAEFQGKASAEIIKQGAELAERLTSNLKQEIENREADIEERKKELESLDENSLEYKQKNKLLLEDQTTLSKLTQNYNESLTQLTNATYAAAGVMSDLEGDEKFTKINSTKENIAGLMDKVGNAEDLDADDWSFLRETVMTQAVDLGLIGSTEEDKTAFLNSFLNGDARVMDILSDVYSNQIKAGEIDFARTIAAYEKILEGKEESLATEQDETTKEALQAEIDTLTTTIAIQKAQKEQLSTVGEKYGYEKEELKLLNAQNELQQLQNALDANSLSNLQKQIEALKILNEERKKAYDEAYEELSQSLKGSGIEDVTADQLKSYVKMVNGVITYDEKWYNSLSNGAKQAVELFVESKEEILSEYSEGEKEAVELGTSYLEKQQEIQDTLIDAYKAQLEEEQEALQESLDKRKDLYDKYFDSLDEEDEDEDFESEQARLQNAIAKLSGATDATSLSKLKEYQEELADLEKDQRQTERDRRRDAVSEMLDNQSEMLDQYYEDRLNNEKVLWEHITDLSNDAQMTLLQNYTDGFKNATDETQIYMMKSFVETMRDMKLMQDENANVERETAYLEAWAKWVQDPDNNDIPHYATGGLVDYTGYAWVDGTSSRPEAFLNADQTALFAGLGNVLSNIYSRGSYNNDSDSQSSVTIENFTIAVDATLTDNNVQQTGESLADALLEGLRRTGISVNMKR